MEHGQEFTVTTGKRIRPKTKPDVPKFRNTLIAKNMQNISDHQLVDHDAIREWVLDYSNRLRDRTKLLKTSKKDVVSALGTFSFTDFELMKQELEFKGNFYEEVKRKSLALRE